MLRTRIIPVLLLESGGLVKTVKFNKPKYVGDPLNAVKIFNDKEVDEIVILDIKASKENRKPNFEAVESIASECFMPLAYGGGIENLEDIKVLFKLGVEKVVLNTHASASNFQLVKEASKIFGNQSIVISIDVVKNLRGKYKIYSHSLGKVLSDSLDEYLQEAIKSGAGEILIQSVNQDGLMTGYDTRLIKKIAAEISVPLVACGGASSVADLKRGFEAGASALAAGSLFLFHGPLKAVLINFPSQKKIKEIFNE